LRLLHVNKFLYRRGGAEAYMFDLARLQAESGDEVAFFGMDHPENDPMPYARHFPSYVEFRDTSIRARARATARMFYSRSAEAGIEAVVKEFRPDVAHLHNIYHQLSPSVLRPLARLGVATIMTLHDYKLACPTYQFLDHGRVCEACLGGHFFHAATHRCKDGSLAASTLAAVESYAHSITGAYSGVRLFIAPSRFLAAKMQQAGVFPERMRLVNHFVDAESIIPTSDPGRGFVYAGRLSPEKGVDVLVGAAGLRPDITVEILGDGPERQRLERLAAELAPGRVHFRGRVPKNVVADAMRSALAVVVPSRWYENQPMTVLESMACAVPVIGTSMGGVPELVTDAVNGFVVPPDDPAALADRMARLAAQPAEARRLGGRARALMLASFTPLDHVRRVGEVYAEALGARVTVPA
jgi:glycosyltransferase involved in cell wall biosynthesis